MATSDIGVLKLNVDGSRKGNTSGIGAGGVIRDHAGHWVAGYSANLGQGQILEAELWGLFFGLKLAVEKHLTDVIVEMDSATAVMLMHKTEIDSCHPTGGLVRNCKGLMNQIGRIRLNHIYRERNSVADRLAAWSHNMDLGFWFFDDSPVWLGPLLLDDAAGASTARLISVL